MDNKGEIMIVNRELLASRIYTIREQKVMLDFELAEIYGYETKRFNEEYSHVNIKFQNYGREFHDRYIIIDWNTDNQRIYHCRASSKDAGQKITSILEVEDQMIYTDLINKLLKNPILKLK